VNKVEHFTLSSDDNICWKHVVNDPEVMKLGAFDNCVHYDSVQNDGMPNDENTGWIDVGFDKDIILNSSQQLSVVSNRPRPINTDLD